MVDLEYNVTIAELYMFAVDPKQEWTKSELQNLDFTLLFILFS